MYNKMYFKPEFGNIKHIQYIKEQSLIEGAKNSDPIKEINSSIELTVDVNFKCVGCKSYLSWSDYFDIETHTYLTEDKINNYVEKSEIFCKKCGNSYIILKGEVYPYKAHRVKIENQLSLF